MKKKGKAENIQSLQNEVNQLKTENGELQKKINRLQIFNDSAFEGIIIHKKGILIDMNEEFGRLFGYSGDELNKQNLFEFLFPSQYHTILQQRILLNYSEPYEMEGKKRDGTFFDVEIEGREIERNGDIVRVTAVRNITKRKNAERAFIKEKYFSDKLINSLTGIFYLYKLINNEYKLIRWNKNHELVTGHSSEELKNMRTSDFFSEEEYPKILAAIEEIFIAGSGKIEGNLKLKDNSTIPYLFEGYNFKDNNEDYFMGVGMDISHQKILEQKILRSIVETEENERTRFSIELHDGLSPLLSACKIYAEAIGLAKNEERKNQAFEMLVTTLDDSISHMHEISNNISPHILRNYGIETAVKSFYLNFESVTNIEFDFQANLKKKLTRTIETSLYRIIVELINNTVKYASSKKITIYLRHENVKLILNYNDDGVGFDIVKELNEPSGMGINNIANRIKILNGSFEIKSSKNKGMSIVVQIPDNKED